MGVTTKDLARICGVSLGTIDRAFRNRPGIKVSTREAILAAAREYGYTPNLIARNLKTRHTLDIGLIVHDLENEFFAQLVNSIQETAWQRGYFLQIAVSRRDPGRERTALEHMAGRNVDGILLFPTSRDGDFDDFLRSLDRPVVTIANKVSSAWPFVGLSDRAIMRTVTESVIAKGYKRLVYVGPLDSSSERLNLYEVEERYAGFLAACEAQGGVDHVLLSGSDYLNRASELDMKGPRTAILCCSDIFALELLRRFKGAGLQAPRDYGLMGFDSIEALRFIEPRLSTVVYPIQRMGERALSLLLDTGDGGESDQTIPFVELEPEIAWGETM
jgi:LacI family transcriptional regulator